MRSKRSAPLPVILIACTAPTVAPAQDEGVRVRIEEITCRELLKMGGDERDFTMIFMHGLISGRRNELVFDGPALAAASERLFDGCIDDPDASLLSVFEAVRS